MSEHHQTEKDLALFKRLFAGKSAGEGIRPGFVDPLFVQRHAGKWFHTLGSMLILSKQGAQLLVQQTETIDL
ncbi:MAG TPA: hypothetical protein VFM33_05095 [Aquabacterium sp.]|nr:hypothetical protein [Aquabacterium sp.]